MPGRTAYHFVSKFYFAYSNVFDFLSPGVYAYSSYWENHLAVAAEQLAARSRRQASCKGDIMKCLKSIGLLAIVAAAVMTSAGTASATSLTSSGGETPTVTETSTNTKLDGSFVTIECEHTYVHKQALDHGFWGTGIRVKWRIDTLHTTGCNYQVTVNQRGTMETDSTSTTGNGTETSTGMSISIHTSVGACIFTTNGTDIGTLDGGTPAVRYVNSAKLPRTGGNFLCGSSATMTGTFTVTSPSTLEVH
jgi:hypothetical protein